MDIEHQMLSFCWRTTIEQRIASPEFLEGNAITAKPGHGWFPLP